MRYLLVIMIMLAGSPLHAEIYKWVDENGQVHFTQHPPEQEATVITPDVNSKVNKTSSKRQKEIQRWLNAQEAEQQQINKKEHERKQNDAESRKKCAEARDMLRTYEQSSGVYRLDEQGNRKFGNKKDKHNALVWARAQVEKWCGK